MSIESILQRRCRVFLHGGISFWRRGLPLLLALCTFYSLEARAVPNIEQWTTANGTRVLYVHAPEIPMIDVRIAFAAGSARDGAKPGLAQLTSTLLSLGTAQLDADEVAARFEALGAQLSQGIDRDLGWVALRSLSEPRYLDPAADLLAQVLAAPRLAAEDLERERQRMRVDLQLVQQSPEELAERNFYAAVYRDHPYASPPEGTTEGLTAIRRADVQQFHARHYRARNATVAIVGALPRPAAERLIERVLKDLPAGEPAPALPPVPELAQPVQRTIPFGSAQTHVFAGQPGMTRTDDDYIALYVANHVLGGSGLVSRLSQEIREQRGLSYSVYSYFLPLAQRGPFMMGLQTRNDQAADATRLLHDTLQTFVAEGPTEAELTAAKQNIVGGFPLRIDSNGKIAEYLVIIGCYGLPLDYLQTFPQRVQAITREQAHAAFKRRIDPGELATVAVGG